MEKKEIQHAHFLLNGFVDNLDQDMIERNYLLELQQWFLEQLKKIDENKGFEVTPCHDTMFHEIPCLEDDERYGFFKSEADVRPGHARWINKECAERLYQILKTG